MLLASKQYKYQNAVSEVERESLDFALNGSIDTDGFGSFVMAGSSTYYTKYETEAVFGSGELTDAVGLLGFPEWRTNAAIRWNMGDWSASWSADYIGESASAVSDTKYKAYTTHNVAVS